MNKFVAIAICAVVPLCLFGQASRTDPNPTLTVGYAPPTAYPPVLAIPGAAIALCSDPACSTRATTYTSSAASSTCPASAQVVLAGTSSCISNSDSRGNFGFWVSSGTYYYTVTVSGKQYGPYPLSVGGGGGGGGNVSGSGTPGFSARWSSSSTIATGSIQDNGGGAVGIGAPPDQILTLSSATSAGTNLHIINTNSSGFDSVRFRNDTGADVLTVGLNGSLGGGNPQITFSQNLSIFPGGVDTIWINPSGTADQFRVYGTGGFNIGATAALATPGSGYGRLWFDSTNLTFQGKSVTGTVSTMVFPQTCAGSTVVGGVNANGTLSCVAGGGGVVSSVGLALPSGVFSISGSPVTSTGVLTGAFIDQTANTGFFGPSSGSAGTPGFRPMVFADLPSISSTQLSDSALLVRTNTSNTWLSGTQSFGLASMILPSSAGFTATNVRSIGTDSTSTNVHLYSGSADSIIATISGTPVNGHCTNWSVSGSVIKIADAGGACGGGGGGSGNFPQGTISGASLIMFSGCTVSGAACNLSRGQGVIDQVSATNTSPAPGTGSDWVYVYWTTSGCVIGSNTGVDILTTGSGPCVGHSTQGITAFPGNATAVVLKAHYSSATWDSSQLVNENPIVSNAPALVQSTGIIINQDGQHATFLVDTSVIPTYSSSAQNLVPHWDSSTHNLVDGIILDNGTGASAGGGAPDAGYTWQVRGNTTSDVFAGVANTDVTNVGRSNLCLTVNGGAAATCLSQSGSASGGGFNFAGSPTVYAFDHGILIIPILVSALPSCVSGIKGEWYPVSDALTPAYNVTLTGGGTGATANVIAFCNGTTWTAH